MPQIHKTKRLPYSCAQMFDLVADVEKYPQFVPWCSAARLIRKTDRELVATLTAQKGAFSKSFTTNNTFVYPRWMDIQLQEGFFKRLHGRWEFTPQADGGCEVSYRMDFEVPLLLGPLVGGLANLMGSTMVDVFSARAQALYG